NPESPIEVTSPLNNTSQEDKSKTFSPSVEFKKLDVADETKKHLNDSHPTKINIQTTSSNDNCCNDNDIPAGIIPSMTPSHSMQYNKCFENASTSSSEKNQDGEFRNGCEITNMAFDTQEDRKKIYQEPHSGTNSQYATKRQENDFRAGNETGSSGEIQLSRTCREDMKRGNFESNSAMRGNLWLDFSRAPKRPRRHLCLDIKGPEVEDEMEPITYLKKQ
ncbi:SH2 domain-containing adapter protein B, partial [Trichonephila clavata]